MANEKDPNLKSFTLDPTLSGVVEMPSVTRLLNRKKLNISNTSKLPPPPLPEKTAIQITPPPPIPLPPVQEITLNTPVLEERRSMEIRPEVREVSLNAAPFSAEIEKNLGEMHEPAIVKSDLPPAPPYSINSPPKIQSVRKRIQKSPDSVRLWGPENVRSSEDPLCKGVNLLLERGAVSAVFFSVSPLQPENDSFTFTVSTIVGSSQKNLFWSGIQWNSGLFPDLWSNLAKTGFLELPPIPQKNSPQSQNTIRTAMGATHAEYLLFILEGPANAPRRLLAVISKNSLLPELPAAVHLINSPKSNAA